MELFMIAIAFTGLVTTIVAIDEYIDWMDSYRREGEEDHREHQTVSYEQFTDEGYRE